MCMVLLISTLCDGSPQGDTRALVPGGVNVKQGERKFQLRLNDKCGASLISSTWILTAAHCLRGASGSWPPDRSDNYVAGGSVDLDDISRLEKRYISFDRKHIIIHEGWNRGKILHDIALLKLSKPFNSSDVEMIKLNEDVTNISPGTQVVISGWGSMSNSGPQERQLKQAILDIEKIGGPSGEQTLVLDNEGGRGACYGDSGGPATTKRNGEDVLVGVDSYISPKDSCGDPNAVTVYTNVYHYLDWIKSHVGSN